MSQNKRLTKEEIQEDKFIDFVLACYTFLKDNIRVITIVVAVVVVGVVGYIGFKQNQESAYAEASAQYSDALTTFQEAEKKFLDVSVPTETEDETDGEEEPDEITFEQADEKLKIIFDKYPKTGFADKARYQYAKSLYYQEQYSDARLQFKMLVDSHKTENQVEALYAQKAIGNCYEQEGEFAKAISAYESSAFPATPNLPPEIRKYILISAKFNEALCHEKLNAFEDAQVVYQDIIDEFVNSIQTGLQQKSQELLINAKDVVSHIEDPLNLTTADKIEADERLFDALVAYTDVIQTYKVTKDIEHGLIPEVRKRIQSFEDLATTFIKNVQAAKDHEKNGSQSSAYSVYNLILDFKELGLNSNLFERAQLNYDRLTQPVNVVLNENE